MAPGTILERMIRLLPFLSKIQSDTCVWLGTAYEHVPGSGHLQRLWVVSNRSINQTGDRRPECGKGNVYGQKEPKALVRVVGQAPLAATVYSLERLRCGACGQVFTAQ